ncbi:MAG: pirin family protein [Bacteriovoracaceae bacterium]|nr:pirin family protein [Bacteriovoracaceae bacterium]
MKRRNFLSLLLLYPATALATGFFDFFKFFKKPSSSMITQMSPIDLHWPTQEPFLFCAHHLDRYPAGNASLGLDAHHFTGRNMGSDFEEKNGFRLYHGREIPGFPVHPHRGFETITIVRRGYADHADSLGAAGRYGEGDVQWMTAGSGVQHSEMFPLLHRDQENTLELFQIWLNLPKKNKMVAPDFKMLWAHKIPKISKDPKVEVTLISGEYEGVKYYEAPKNSWASEAGNAVTILLVKLQSGGVFKMPKSAIQTNRSLYLFQGAGVSIDEKNITGKQALFLDESQELEVVALNGDAEFLFLEAKPIGEPVVQHGPFVMNTKQEIMQTFQDYQATHFGGWKWEREDMIHGAKIEKFAKYPDGRIERPG